MPPPNGAVLLIRSVARSLKNVLKSLFQRVKGCRATDMEASAGEEKATEKALEEYRQSLQNTFGGSKALDDAIREVGWWIDGL